MVDIPNIVPNAKFFNIEFDPNVKEVYDLIKSGNGLKNPLAGVIDTTETAIQDAIETLTPIAQSAGTIGNLTSQQVTDLITDLESASISNLDYLAKTNRISGVDISTGDFPSFAQVTSVGMNSVALEHIFNETVGNPCGKLAGLFLPIIIGKDLYNEIATFYQGLIGGIEDLTFDYNQIKSTLDGYITQTTNLITNFQNYFDNLVADLLEASLAQTMGSLFRDPCGKHILDEVLGDHEMTDILSKL